MRGYLPDYKAGSIYDIDYVRLYKLGIRGIAVDIDNTLVPMHTRVVSKEAVKWAGHVKSIGFKVWILSNANKKRTEYFMKKLEVKGIWHANKPFKKSYIRLASEMGLKPEECVMIGDQLFTDIRGGKKAGFMTVLTKPTDTREILYIRFKRIFENLILKKYGERIKSI